MKLLKALALSTDGSTAAEFAMVLPALLVAFFGTIEVGLFFWSCNQAEKATQIGARVAVVTGLVPEGVATHDFTQSTPAGTPVPTTTYLGTDCFYNKCENRGGIGPAPGFNGNAFERILAPMKAVYPGLKAENLIVSYENVGIGFAGDPTGPDVSPLVSVRIVNLRFSPITQVLLPITVQMPTFLTSLTSEDGIGTEAYF
jgi:hypothetical protein